MMEKSSKRILTCLVIGLIWIAQIFRSYKLQANEITDFRAFWDTYYNSLAYGLSLSLICFLLFYLNKDRNFLRSSKRSVSKQILFGLPIGIAITAVVYIAIGKPIEIFFPELDGDKTTITPFVTQGQYLPFWILLSVIKGGFAEELFRVSALHHFKVSWGKQGLILAAIASSIVYGFTSYHLGWDTVISGTFRGLLFAGLYIWRGSATELIAAHSFRDILAILAAYFILQ